MTQINHPDYYTKDIEVIDFIECYELNFSLGNAVKYIARAGHKENEDPRDALNKAIWYLEHEIDRLNEQGRPLQLLEN